MGVWAGPAEPAELIVEGLSVAYGPHSPVVRDVGFSVPPGSTLVLLGANGAGKTSIMRAVTGLLGEHRGRMLSGSIRLDGREVSGLSASQRVRAGMAQTMEGRRIFGELSLEDNLRAGSYARRDRKAIKRDLEMFFDRFPELADRRKEKAGYLSGGQLQMLAMGRALMARPRLLLLDEPSLGLAPQLVDRVADIIRELAAGGVTITLIEQNVAMGLEVSEHAVVLEAGAVVVEGPSADLRKDERIQSAYLGAQVSSDA